MSVIMPRPEVEAPGEWSFPQPREFELPNGIRALVHDVPGQYVVSVRVTIPAALRHEPREVEGVAWIMARLLDEGTLTHGQRELSELLERKGIAIGAGMSEASLGFDRVRSCSSTVSSSASTPITSHGLRLIHTV